MLGRRARDADDSAWWEELAGDDQWHIGLPEMDTGRASRERNIYAIIDDNGYVVPRAQRDSIVGCCEELSGYLRRYSPRAECPGSAPRRYLRFFRGLVRR